MKLVSYNRFFGFTNGYFDSRQFVVPRLES